MRSSINHFLLFSLAFLLNLRATGQAYQFKNYSIDNGISQPYIYTINQGKNGYLWIGTGEGLCKYDGLRFKSFYSTDGIAENFVTTSYRDKQRNLWMGHYQGSITVYNGKDFKAINTSGFSKSPVTCITGDDNGNIWCATQNDGVFRINKNFEVDVFKMEFNQENVFSIQLIKNDQLLAGTANGLMLYNLRGEKHKPEFIGQVDNGPQTRINCIIRKNNSGSFWVGTEDEGLYLLTPSSSKANSFRVEQIGNTLNIEPGNVQDIYEDPQSNLWIATFGKGLFKLILDKSSLKYNDSQHFDERNGLVNNYLKKLYCDHEGNIWVGTYGSGLVQITDNCFTVYSHSDSTYSNNTTALLPAEGIKWFGLDKGLLRIDANSKSIWQFFGASNGFTNDKVTALCQPSKEVLLIGTEHQGLFEMELPSQKIKPITLSEDNLTHTITSIVGNAEHYYVGTRGGLFDLEPQKRIMTHYSTDNGLPHNNINQLFLDHDGTLWIATHSNYIAFLTKNGALGNKQVYFGNDLINVTSIHEDSKHQLWAATFGNGVYCIHGKTITHITTETGLKSNYCYAIGVDGSDNVWVGHRLGLSRIKTGKNVIDQFDKNDGINGDCNYGAIVTDVQGNVWFGTTMGTVKYDPHKDKKNMIPPIVNLFSVKLNDREIELSKDTVLPHDDYRMRFDFIGISFKANTRVSYQYKLEGYDVDWSDNTFNNFVQYGKLSEGDYTFLLKAYNSDGVGNAVPLSIKFSISPPIWKRSWFILLVIAASLYILYAIIKFRERSHRRFQAQLQKSLNERTREVIQQKEEIEKKNKDITDSIRYAKRIQDALLPEVNKLQYFVPESFIFFQPRDIVSGDFYWYEKYGDLLIIACADATGHGVPGAFMSMIGSTLLKDITSRKGVNSPAFALALLDEEIKMLLKQRDTDLDQTQDGVDLVICEINLKTHFARICSTKRPVFIVHKGELKLYKKEVSENQQYETIDLQLEKGDSIYMFTDGYPDQFGGEKGKKIKTSHMRTMLEQIHTLPVAKQKMIIDHYFNSWMEGYEQVDDVLFMGIRL